MTDIRNELFQGHGRISRYVPFILSAGMILFLSSGEASMEKTSRFIRPLLEFLFPAASEVTLQYFHGSIRKLAHLTEYAVLAMTAVRAFRGSSKRFLERSWLVAALLTVLIVAIIDEFNQSLIPARTGSVSDVFLDFAGGVLGIVVFACLFRIFGKKQEEIGMIVN